ncbi:hypothetical protein ACFPYI_12525 [Halomarina salina]|uniref:Uncharacterized protein n=1 Tax=Halomarina salina TaxID=1872699 RepID=A0ABD5RND3_9EURY|nr:hypothetical protein [Halomarina salina]
MLGDESVTECIDCGLQAGYNRAVVDTALGRELGGLCFRCEEREFGRSLGRGNWETTVGCAFCDRDGFYALPEWKPYCEDVDGRRVCKVDYRVDEATLRLCDEHFSCLYDGPPRQGVGSQERDDRRVP